MGGGQTISSTATPSGASTLSVVGIRSGSLGLFDWVWSPSGTETFKATRAIEPARAGPSTRGNTSAFGRVVRAGCALAVHAPSKKTNAKTRNLFTFVDLLPASIDLLQRDQGLGNLPWSSFELDRRQILEHEVPLPSLHRVGRLQPMTCRHRTCEGKRGEAGISFVAFQCRSEVATNGGAAGVGQRSAKGQTHVDEYLPVFLRVLWRRDGVGCGLQPALGVDERAILLDPR